MAGRPGLGLKEILVGFRVETLDRIDSAVAAGKRGDFIRCAVEAALCGVDYVTEEAAVPKVAPRGMGVARAAFADRQAAQWAQDDAEALKGLRGRMTVRELSLSLGWVEMRAERSVHRLVEAGVAYLPGSGIVEPIL